MSDEAEAPVEAAVAPKKGKAGLLIAIIVALVTLVGGSVAGAVLGPKLLGGSEEAPSKPAKPEKKPKKAHGAEGGEDEGDAPQKVVPFDIMPVVVDLRDGDGRIRHLKVGMTAELYPTTLLDEVKTVAPRAREAVLTYVRSLSFEEVSEPQQFIAIRDELAKRAAAALGEDRVHRIVLTDFVVQ